MSETLPSGITLRPASTGDCRALWEWRNEPLTREASFQTDGIPYERHVEWFSKKLDSPDTRIWIVQDERSRRVGYVRFQIQDGEAEISVSLDPAERGKGYGSAAVRMATDSFLASRQAGRVKAYIKPGNPASVRSFEKAGFETVGRTMVSGAEVIEMVRSR